MTNRELRELRDRVTYYGVIGVPLNEEDTQKVCTALSAYLNLRPIHAEAPAQAGRAEIHSG